MGGMGLTRHSQSTTITQIPRFTDRFPLLKILFDPKTMLLNVFFLVSCTYFSAISLDPIYPPVNVGINVENPPFVDHCPTETTAFPHLY